MDIVLKISNLNYRDFHNINLSFFKGEFYFIVGGNKCGKTTLFRIISSLNATENCVICNNVVLNTHNKHSYIRNIGVVEKVNIYSFNYKNVKDEMLYPLYNLGYSYLQAKKKIEYVLSYFHANDFYNKKICDLNYEEKQKLLIMIPLLYHPKVLLMDNVLEIFSKRERIEIIELLKRIVLEDKLTILNFTSSLQDIKYSNRIIVLSNYKVIKETTFEEIFENDKLFYQNGLEIPFAFDIVIKLKMYNLINKNYVNLQELVDDIWD